MENNATPRPWQRGRGGWVEDLNGLSIADCGQLKYPGVAGYPVPEQDANAELIVEAVNSYAALTSTCRWQQDQLKTFEGQVQLMDDAYALLKEEKEALWKEYQKLYNNFGDHDRKINELTAANAELLEENKKLKERDEKWVFSSVEASSKILEYQIEIVPQLIKMLQKILDSTFRESMDLPIELYDELESLLLKFSKH